MVATIVIIMLACACGFLATAADGKRFGVPPKAVSEQTPEQRRRVRERKREERIENQARAQRELESGLARIIGKLAPATEEQRAAQRADLARTGLKINSTTFWAMRCACVIAGVLLGAALTRVVPGEGLRTLGCILLGGAVGYTLPQLYLIDQRTRWRAEIERQLPNALDLMSVSVSAGSTLESAIRTVANNSEGALADALRDVIVQSQYMDVTEALRMFSDRAGVQPLTIFTASLIQARKGGLALADILKLQAETVRQYRRQKLEEEINKLPIKIIFPIVFFIFPALFGVVLLPAAQQLLAALGA